MAALLCDESCDDDWTSPRPAKRARTASCVAVSRVVADPTVVADSVVEAGRAFGLAQRTIDIAMSVLRRYQRRVDLDHTASDVPLRCAGAASLLIASKLEEKDQLRSRDVVRLGKCSRHEVVEMERTMLATLDWVLEVLPPQAA